MIQLVETCHWPGFLHAVDPAVSRSDTYYRYQRQDSGIYIEFFKPIFRSQCIHTALHNINRPNSRSKYYDFPLAHIQSNATCQMKTPLGMKYAIFQFPIFSDTHVPTTLTDLSDFGDSTETDDYWWQLRHEIRTGTLGRIFIPPIGDVADDSTFMQLPDKLTLLGFHRREV